MNTDHSPLILAYLDGTISGEEMARLNALLLESADARAQLRSWAAAEVRLRELAADAAHAAAVRPGTRESQAGAGTTVSWLDRVLLRGWRAPIAAGLAIGAAFTSVVWAYVVPPTPEPSKHLTTLLADGFETGSRPGNGFVPREFGMWGGDHAEVATAGAGLAPRTGARMLRLLRSDYVGEKSVLSHVGDQLQVIDLAAYRAAIESGRVVAHAEAWFNQVVPGAGEEFAGGVTLFAFARDPRAYRSETWNVWYEGHLGFSGQQQERTDRDPATWERVSTNLPLPPATRFLVVQLRVNRTKPEPTATPVTFAG
ncbi:MAG: hypothetical protein EXS40_07120, partial [Opitutaceae bacterium]|nr:hypothetical protein [Opitutaceae bacterium]